MPQAAFTAAVVFAAIAFPLKDARGSTGSPAPGTLQELSRLYPGVGEPALRSRIRSAPSTAKFFRTFVPYFYERSRVELAGSPLRKALGDLTGWCAGDAHIENFGSILDSNHRARFTLNDMDDAGPCPLALDFVRFLTSVSLAREGFPLEPLIASYRSGLAGEDRRYSPPVLDLLSAAESDGRRAKKKDVSRESLKLVRGSDTLEISPAVRAALVAALTEAYKGMELLDACERLREEGGSAGLKRYEALVRTTGSSAAEVMLELKELGRPGIFPVAAGALPSSGERISKTLRLQQDGKGSELYRTFSIDGRDFLLRPKWKGNKRIDLKKLKRRQESMVFSDEAYTLGRFHRIAADHPKEYADKAAKLADAEWIRAAGLMSSSMRRSHAAALAQIKD